MAVNSVKKPHDAVMPRLEPIFMAMACLEGPGGVKLLACPPRYPVVDSVSFGFFGE